MENLVGIYWVLAVLPTWVILTTVIVIVQLMILVGRHALEGIPYQVAYSALVGEGLCFTVMIVIVAGILQRGEVYVPLWFQSGTVHIWLVANCLVFGVVVCWLTLRSRWGHMMDIYHDVVVIPLILYSAITLLPVVFYSGTRVEQWTVVVFILLWLVSFAFDVKYDRLNQRRLLVRSIDAIEDMKEEDLRR